MINRLLIKLLPIVLILLIGIPASSETVNYYDSTGKMVSYLQYEKTNSMRVAEINRILKEGYNKKNSVIKDPGVLRKKRIEQWEKYRYIKKD